MSLYRVSNFETDVITYNDYHRIGNLNYESAISTRLCDQKATYVEKSLEDHRSDTREAIANGVIRSIAVIITDDNIPAAALHKQSSH